MNYCPSDYQRGDENNPRSPFYEELPEGWFETEEEAIAESYGCPVEENEHGYFVVREDW